MFLCTLSLSLEPTPRTEGGRGELVFVCTGQTVADERERAERQSHTCERVSPPPLPSPRQRQSSATRTQHPPRRLVCV